MAIDIRLMRYVVAVAEEGGFQRAAKRLLVAQPSLSRQIRDLERELGVTLFERKPAVHPTDAGCVFVESARTVLAETDRLIERTMLAGRGELGTVRVGYIHSAVFDTVPRVVAAMAEHHPGVTVDVRENWTPDLDTALLAGEYDLVLSRDMPPRPEYQRETLRPEGLVAVVGESHPLAGRETAALREFAGQRFCHPHHNLAPGRHAYMISALRQSGETFEYRESPVHGLSHLDLADGHSFALVPDSAVGRVPVGTATIAITDDLPCLTLEMVWRRDTVSAALGVLVSTARELARREGWYVP